MRTPKFNQNGLEGEMGECTYGIADFGLGIADVSLRTSSQAGFRLVELSEA